MAYFVEIVNQILRVGEPWNEASVILNWNQYLIVIHNAWYLKLHDYDKVGPCICALRNHVHASVKYLNDIHLGNLVLLLILVCSHVYL